MQGQHLDSKALRFYLAFGGRKYGKQMGKFNSDDLDKWEKELSKVCINPNFQLRTQFAHIWNAEVRVSKPLSDEEKKQLLKDPFGTENKETEYMSKRENMHQWTKFGKGYHPGGIPVKNLKAGFYEAYQLHGRFVKMVKNTSVADSKILNIESPVYNKVIKEVDMFWKNAEKYRAMNLSHKRGYVFYGPPGTGKTTLIRMLMDYMESIDGVSVVVPQFNTFMDFYENFRQIEKTRPLAIIMEELEHYIGWRGNATILGVLDGLVKLDNVVFFATTNHVENFEPRVIDRPGRFDGVYRVSIPGSVIRRNYITEFCKNSKVEITNIEEWVLKTEGMSVAHMREILISVFIFNKTLDESIMDSREKYKDIGETEDKNSDAAMEKKAQFKAELDELPECENPKCGSGGV